MIKSTPAYERTLYAKSLIQRLNYLTLATTDNSGQPWNTPVFCAYDGKKTFYWGSRQNTQHSQNIAQEARGFIVIYDSTVEPYHGEAVYAQVLCEELGEPREIAQAIELLHARLGESYMTPADVQGSAEHRLYKATVINAWIKDPERDVREEVILA
jgi:hypothetical protein